MTTSTINANISIVESGTSNGWVWRKFSDGTAECWGIKTHNVTGWNAWGNIYESSTPAYWSYPSGLFKENPVFLINASPNGNGGTIGVEVYGVDSKDGTPSVYPLRPTSDLTGMYYFAVHAIGKWK